MVKKVKSKKIVNFEKNEIFFLQNTQHIANILRIKRKFLKIKFFNRAE